MKRIKYNIYVPLLSIIIVCSQTSSQPLNHFPTYSVDSVLNYLEVSGHNVKTLHRLSAEVRVEENYKCFGNYNFRESYDGVSFNVSTTTFANSKNILFIHAEERTDGKGNIDYPELKTGVINGYKCFIRTGCFNLFEENEEDLKGNKYLKFLKEKNFDFNQGLNLVQFLFVNKDRTAEVVLSFAKRMEKCPGKVDEEMTESIITKAKVAFKSFRIK